MDFCPCALWYKNCCGILRRSKTAPKLDANSIVFTRPMLLLLRRVRHYLLKELLIMERQQTSKINAAQNEAFQAALVAKTTWQIPWRANLQSVFHDEDADREGRAIAQTEARLRDRQCRSATRNRRHLWSSSWLVWQESWIRARLAAVPCRQSDSGSFLMRQRKMFMSSSAVLLRMALAEFKVTQQLAIRELLDVSSLFRTFMEALFIAFRKTCDSLVLVYSCYGKCGFLVIQFRMSYLYVCWVLMMLLIWMHCHWSKGRDVDLQASSQDTFRHSLSHELCGVKNSRGSSMDWGAQSDNCDGDESCSRRTLCHTRWWSQSPAPRLTNQVVNHGFVSP